MQVGKRVLFAELVNRQPRLCSPHRSLVSLTGRLADIMESFTLALSLTWIAPGALLLATALTVLYWRRLTQLRRTSARQTRELINLRHELSHRVNTNLAMVIGLLEAQ